MTDRSANKDNARCPRCKNSFECLPGYIGACWCSKVELSKEEYMFVNTRYQQCVCSACLKTLKEEYAQQQQQQQSNKTF
jgi:hypothetical protein